MATHRRTVGGDSLQGLSRRWAPQGPRGASGRRHPPPASTRFGSRVQKPTASCSCPCLQNEWVSVRNPPERNPKRDRFPFWPGRAHKNKWAHRLIGGPTEMAKRIETPALRPTGCAPPVPAESDEGICVSHDFRTLHEGEHACQQPPRDRATGIVFLDRPDREAWSPLVSTSPPILRRGEAGRAAGSSTHPGRAPFAGLQWPWRETCTASMDMEPPSKPSTG